MKQPVILRKIIKEIIIDLYCRGVLPKDIAQRIFNKLRLKHE